MHIGVCYVPPGALGRVALAAAEVVQGQAAMAASSPTTKIAAAMEAAPWLIFLGGSPTAQPPAPEVVAGPQDAIFAQASHGGAAGPPGTPACEEETTKLGGKKGRAFDGWLKGETGSRRS